MSPLKVFRKYRAGMVVRFEGRRWQINAVEFWETHERLSLYELDGKARVVTREVRSTDVEFTGEFVS